MPRIGAWVAIVAIYAGSLVGCVWSLPRIRTKSGGAALVVVVAMTLTGIAQFATYVAMSKPWRLYAASIPAIFVLAFWVDRLARRSALGPRGFRRSIAYCAYSGALLVVLQLAQPLGEWIDHSSYESLAREWPLRWTGGCPSFPSCLRRPKAEYGVTEQAERLIRKHVPRGEPVAVFLAENATTEVLFRTGRRHAFPLSAPLQDGLVRSNGNRILNAAHTLAPGDLIFVARESLVVKRWGNWLLGSIVDRICLEFECRVENRVGLITVERLHAR